MGNYSLFPPQPEDATDLLSVSVDCFFWTFYINVVISYTVFVVTGFFHSVQFLRFTHTVAYNNNL